MFNSILGISWLWFLDRLPNGLAPFGREVLGGDEAVVTSYCYRCFFDRHRRRTLLMIAVGTRLKSAVPAFIGMTVFALDLYFASRGIDGHGVCTLVNRIPAREVHGELSSIWRCISASWVYR